MTAAQSFNADILFLYKIVEDDDGKKLGPAWKSGRSDWNRRLLESPSLSRRITGWNAEPETTEVSFTLANTDGSVWATINGSLGVPVGIFAKASENPTTWWPIYSGYTTKLQKTTGKVTVSCQDSVKNLYNAYLVEDYIGIATFMGDMRLYGTVKDVIGSNVYLDDAGYTEWIRRKADNDDDWFGVIAGWVVGAALGAISGPGAAILGGIGGAMKMWPQGGGNEQYYLRVTDYNVIPEGKIFGGQPLKFYSATVEGRATNTRGRLYGVPSQRVKGGQFVYGIYGTIELDDIFHNVKKGDYVYSQLPKIFMGSPDDIIVNLLTGSNISQKYRWPEDFSDDWFEQSNPLRHIDCYMYMSDLATVRVTDIIGGLAQEFGFAFYIDERNKFALRTMRQPHPRDTSVVATFAEHYNIVGDGVDITYEIQDTFTDARLYYKETIIQDMYDMHADATYQAASYFGNIRRTKEIRSKWIHDSLTADYTLKRLGRKWANPTEKIRFTAPLYSVPVGIGKFVRIIGPTVGTSFYEVTGYTKNFGDGLTEIEAESLFSTTYASYTPFYVGTGYALWPTYVTPNADLADYYAPGYETVERGLIGDAGTFGTFFGSNFWDTDTQLIIYRNPSNHIKAQAGSYFYIFTDTTNNSSVFNWSYGYPRGRSDIMAILSIEDAPATTIGGTYYEVSTLTVDRAQFNTVPTNFLGPIAESGYGLVEQWNPGNVSSMWGWYNFDDGQFYYGQKGWY